MKFVCWEGAKEGVKTLKETDLYDNLFIASAK